MPFCSSSVGIYIGTGVGEGSGEAVAASIEVVEIGIEVDITASDAVGTGVNCNADSISEDSFVNKPVCVDTLPDAQAVLDKSNITANKTVKERIVLLIISP